MVPTAHVYCSGSRYDEDQAAPFNIQAHKILDASFIITLVSLAGFTISHFIVLCSVPWPLNRSEAGGGPCFVTRFVLENSKHLMTGPEGNS